MDTPWHEQPRRYFDLEPWLEWDSEVVEADAEWQQAHEAN